MRAHLALLLVLVCVCSASGQEAHSSSATPADASATIAELLAFEKNIEAAVVRGDVAFLDRACASDFTFTHGDAWTSGGKPLRVDNKTQWLASVATQPFLSRELGPVQVELHGDVAITYGMYRARNKSTDPARNQTTIWFERVYARRNGQWQYLSHRTVHGPTYVS